MGRNELREAVGGGASRCPATAYAVRESRILAGVKLRFHDVINSLDSAKTLHSADQFNCNHVVAVFQKFHICNQHDCAARRSIKHPCKVGIVVAVREGIHIFLVGVKIVIRLKNQFLWKFGGNFLVSTSIVFDLDS